jgi:RNA 3'-phosphate cyclase
MIQINGSHGEGGGQIVRTALAFSTLLGKAFEANEIRSGRKEPGLKAQHLACIKALEQLCDAKTGGAELGSVNLRYIPGKIKAKKIEIDIGTAGSITLLLQSLLPACVLADRKINLSITGGTSGKWQMPVDYFMQVFAPQLRRYADIKIKMTKRGYYPKGGGKVEISISPKFTLETKDSAPKIEIIEQGHLQYIKGVSHASKDLQENNVAERQAKAAEIMLKEFGCPVNIDMQYAETLSTGSGITLWAVFSAEKDEISELNPIRMGADTAGELGKRAEEVGTEAAKQLIAEIKSGAPIDEHLADNLIPFLALFGGKIRVSKTSSHTLTNIYAAEQFIGKIFSSENSIIESKPVKQA